MSFEGREMARAAAAAAVREDDGRFSRRRLLAGLGASAAFVPLLSAGRAWGAPAPKRFLFIQWTNGVLTKHFWPSGSETTFQMGTCTAPLAPYRDDVMVLQGVDLESAMDDPFCKAGHATLPHLLTGMKSAPTDVTGGDPGSRGIGNAQSVDQYIASAIARTSPTPLKSLELGVQTGGQRPTHGHISFKGPALNKSYPDANKPEENPYNAFKRLFEGSALPTEAFDRLRAERKSVLDVVGKSAERLAKSLGTEDRVRIEEHLGSVRTLEKEIQAAATGGGGACAGKLTDNVAFADRGKYHDAARLHFELAALAFKCDVTRVITVMFSNSTGSQQTFAFLGGEFLKPSNPGSGVGSGSTVGHHEIAHAAGDGDHALKITVDKWYVEHFAGVIKRFKETTDPSGAPLLDRSLLVLANHMGIGAAHNVNNVPFILAGSAGGYYKTGKFLKMGGASHTGLLASFANAMDVPTTRFGDPKYDNFAAVDPRLRG